MSFFEGLNGGLEAMFKELSKSKRIKDRKRREGLQMLEFTPFLLDSSYLLDLTDGANKEECDTILDYLYRFNNHVTDITEDGELTHLNILGIDSYKSIETQIIDKRWK